MKQNEKPSTELGRGAIAAAMLGQIVVAVDVTGDGPDDGYVVVETTGGVRLYADAPTAYAMTTRREAPAIAAIVSRLEEADAEYKKIIPGRTDDSVLEAERDTLEWVLATLRGDQ